MATTLQQAINQLRVWFPLDAPFWQQVDGNVPADGEMSLRSALSLSRSVTLANHLAQTAAASSNAQAGVSAANAAFSAAALFKSSHWGSYFGAGFNFAGLYVSADEKFDLIQPNTVSQKWQYNGFGAAENFNQTDVQFSGGIAPMTWPYCLFDAGSFNVVDSMVQAFRWTQNFWASNYNLDTVPVPVTDAMAALLRDLPLIEQAVNDVSQLVNDTQKTASRVEAEILAGFTAAGVGTVLFGGAFTAATATLAGEIAAAAAEDLAELASGMLTRAIAAGEAAGESATIASIAASVASMDAELRSLLDDHTRFTAGDGLQRKVSELLGQTSVLINGQETRLLDNLFVKHGSEIVPLSDALKGAVYQDTAGTERHALVTLASVRVHQDLEATT